MATQKPLVKMIPEILSHIRVVQEQQTIFEKRVLDMYDGSLQKYLEDSMDQELEASGSAKKRIAPINVLPKIVDKSSKVYNLGVSRELDGSNELDLELMSGHETSMQLDVKMVQANKWLTLFRYCALEPYICNNKSNLRVLNPTQFTVYSDDPKNDLNMTVFIKYMGCSQKEVPRTDSHGRPTEQAETVVVDVNIFHLYSDDEFLIIDSAGDVRFDLMAKVGNFDGVNPIGKIPFIYLSSSEVNLIPMPRMDMYTMPILIPKLISDLNWAVKFQSHAIIYTVDIDAENMQATPDSMWNLKSDTDGKTGSVGTVKPDVDVDKVLNLIKSELSLWFDSLNITSAATKGINASNMESGLSKALDSIDSEELRKSQIPVFINAEKQLWDLMRYIHEFWVVNGLIESNTNFSKDFKPLISFGDTQVIPDPKAEIDLIVLKLNNKLTSYRRAVAKANPDLTAEEVNNLLQEILEEDSMKTKEVVDFIEKKAEE